MVLLLEKFHNCRNFFFVDVVLLSFKFDRCEMTDRIQVSPAEAQEAVEIVYAISERMGRDMANKNVALDESLRERIWVWHLNFIGGKTGVPARAKEK